MSTERKIPRIKESSEDKTEKKDKKKEWDKIKDKNQRGGVGECSSRYLVDAYISVLCSSLSSFTDA